MKTWENSPKKTQFRTPHSSLLALVPGLISVFLTACSGGGKVKFVSGQSQGNLKGGADPFVKQVSSSDILLLNAPEENAYSNLKELNVTVSAPDITHYQYVIVSGETTCSASLFGAD